MKHILKGLAVVLAIALLMPMTMASADDAKIEAVLAAINESETMKNVKGAAYYYDDMIEFNYSTQNWEYSTLIFPYEGTVVEYTPGEVTTYEEATETTARSIYAVRMLYSVLQMNGYEQEEIAAYLQSEDSKPTFEVNGFVIEPTGDAQEYDSEDGSAHAYYTPMHVKFDVARANLNEPGSDAVEPNGNTVQDLVDYLEADEEFMSMSDDDGSFIFLNVITCEDDGIVIDHTDFIDEYHSITFDCVDGVMTYSIEEIADYDEANALAERTMCALLLAEYALQENGYSQEEIAAFFGSEESEFDFDRNGIEFKPLGEAETFEGDLGDVTVTPVSIKIDFAKANLDPAPEEDVSEDPVTPTTPASPDTGDPADAAVITACLLLAAAAALALVLVKRQNAAE